MKVRLTVRFKCDRAPRSMTVERSVFAEHAANAEYMGKVDWLIADVCLTRWFYDSATGWWSSPRTRYVPGEPDKWRLSLKDMVDRMKYSARGFTQC